VQENLWKTLQSHDKFDADIKQALGAVSPSGSGGSTGPRCAFATLAPLHVEWPSGLSPLAWQCMSAIMAPVVTRAPFRYIACIDTALLRPAVEAFVETDKAYLADEANSKKDDGCTAVAAVLLEDRLIVANVGDSRAVLSRGGKGAPKPFQTVIISRTALHFISRCCILIAVLLATSIPSIVLSHGGGTASPLAVLCSTAGS
jgi:Protein phosphatase 2C